MEKLVSIRMPQHLVDELRAVATENDRTLSDQARLALRDWLAQHRKKAAA